MVSSIVETVKCDFCGSTESEIITRLSMPDGVELIKRRCSSCNLVYLSPRYTEAYALQTLEEFHRVERRRSPEANAGTYLMRRDYYSIALRLARKYAPGRRLLDVGCGRGHFLARAAQGGWNGLGIDISREVAVDAYDNYGVQILVGDVSTLDIPRHSLDVITMLHALEHVRSPMRTLKVVRDLLAPDGVVIIIVPNESYETNVVKRLSKMIKKGVRLTSRFSGSKSNSQIDSTGHGHVGHLYYFEESSLRQYFDALGLQTIWVSGTNGIA